jgi:hypothetical protein
MNRPDLSRVRWRKARRSSGNGACVEIAGLRDVAAVRDSKAPASGVLLLSAGQWRALLVDVREGRHDLS